MYMCCVCVCSVRVCVACLSGICVYVCACPWRSRFGVIFHCSSTSFTKVESLNQTKSSLTQVVSPTVCPGNLLSLPSYLAFK